MAQDAHGRRLEHRATFLCEWVLTVRQTVQLCIVLCKGGEE